MKKLLLLSATLVSLATSASAQQTLDFEDHTMANQGFLLTNGYHGLNWINLVSLDATELGRAGVLNSRHSGDWVAYNLGGAPAQILPGTDPFTFNSAWFGSAWRDNLTLDITGNVNGVATYFATLTLQTTGGTQFHLFDWTNLSSITFVTSGGTDAGYGSGDADFTMDDLSVFGAVETTTPEPASIVLMMTGMLGVAAGARRRKRR